MNEVRQKAGSVLVVDDSITYRERLREVLEAAGYEVRTAASGEEAMARLGERVADCVLIDMVMPGMDGFEACRRIRAAPDLRATSILMLTSREGKQPMVEALSAGADDFVTKADDLEVLEARIRAHVRRLRIEEENRRMRELLAEARLSAEKAKAERELSETRARLLCDLEAKNAELGRAKDRAELGVIARDEFLCIASHELRTPLTSLKLHLQSIRRSLASSGAAALAARHGESIDVAIRQTDRLGRLVDGLLDASRISAGHLELRAERFDLAVLVREVAERLGPSARKAGSALAVRTEPLTGSWDRLRCEQVAENLLSNAIKYGDGAPIEVELARDQGRARLVVRDHGVGIAAEQRQRIFGIFERASSSRNYGGLGLGLYITRQIVEAHGGAIELESAVGVGSTFTAWLPLDSPA